MNESSSQLEQYIAAGKRQWWVVLQAVVIVGVVAAIFASREPDPPYKATTTFLVRPEYDVNGRLMATFAVTVSSQTRALTNPAVLDAAAQTLPGETAAAIGSTIATSTDSTNGIITMTVTADDPSRPVPITEAVASAFIEDRRVAKTAALEELATAADSEIQTLQDRISALNTQLAVAQGEGRPTAAIDAAITTSTQRLTSAVGKADTARSQIAVADPGVVVLSPAFGAVPGEKPSPAKRALIGAGIGLIIGIALAAVRETLDQRLRTRAGVENASGLPVIAELPEERIKSKGQQLPIIDQPGGSLAEAIRGLRTTLRYLGSTDPIGSIVVTSPQAGDGKTMTAANLAASFAASGVSTVLVSADLRRPALDVLFGAGSMVGLSDLLAGAWPGPPVDIDLTQPVPQSANGGRTVIAREISAEHIEPLLRPTAIENLRFLPAGRLPPNPSELLSSERAAKVFGALGDLAEIVIVDSPPTVVADSTVLAGLVDSALLVVAIDRTRRVALRKARQTLTNADTRIIGVALNRVRNSDSTYSSYYTSSSRTHRSDAASGRER